MIKVYIFEAVKSTPKSWNKVMYFLHNEGLITKIPVNFNPQIWESRGVVFVNDVSQITTNSPVFLWGNCDLQIPNKIYKCTHPSTLGTWRFNGFREIDMNWNVVNSCDFYTDGSYAKKRGGWSIVCDGNVISYGRVPEYLLKYEDELIITEIEQRSTNQRAELLAVIKCLLHIRIFGESEIRIFSDSMYCVNIYNTWMVNWKKSGKIMKNMDLVDILYTLQGELGKKNINVVLVHVEGHSGDLNNSLADTYANKGREMN
jgi:ribonuclease HI